jgi:hypothetical protein
MWPHAGQRPACRSTSLEASAPHLITNGASEIGLPRVHAPDP